jgi:general secretion pathway protein K
MKKISQRAAAEGSGKDAGGKSLSRCLGAPSGRRGVVLIAVLWCCAMIMWAGLQISAQTRLLGEDQLHSIVESHARYLAIGGCYEALARMVHAGPLQSELPSDQNWQPDGNPRVVVYNTGIAVVIMEAEDQKINVNTADATQLAKVLENAGADEQTARIVAGRITEFVNSQNSSHLQGQANTDLRKGLKHDSGFGGPLTSLDQLLLVPGVGQQLFYGYQQGPDHIAMPAGNSLFSQLTTQSGNANQPQGIQNLQGGQGASLPQTSWTAGGIYRILSFGKSAMGLPSVGVWLTVRLQDGGDAPYQILSRKVL